MASPGRPESRRARGGLHRAPTARRWQRRRLLEARVVRTQVGRQSKAEVPPTRLRIGVLELRTHVRSRSFPHFITRTAQVLSRGSGNMRRPCARLTPWQMGFGHSKLNGNADDSVPSCWRKRYWNFRKRNYFCLRRWLALGEVFRTTPMAASSSLLKLLTISIFISSRKSPLPVRYFSILRMGSLTAPLAFSNLRRLPAAIGERPCKWCVVHSISVGPLPLRA